MVVARWNRLYTLGVGLLALACGDSGTEPPGPPAELVITGGDAQSWYFNNPLPQPLTVTAQDLSGRPVPGVVITWSVTQGGGGVNPAQSTTNASGVAATTDSVGSSTLQRVSATFTGLSGPVSFTAQATTPPTADSVSIANIAFNPATVVVQVNGTVTWTWSDNGTAHNVTYTAAPGPLPAGSPRDQTTGTFSTTFLQVGTYKYMCTHHAQMNNGVVTVVH
ncbi:MAG TPA: plastocyanin/azurin family copper-binding protein [Gemmatimonadales bacterium]